MVITYYWTKKEKNHTNLHKVAQHFKRSFCINESICGKTIILEKFLNNLSVGQRIPLREEY